jgi:hypothetical protein
MTYRDDRAALAAEVERLRALVARLTGATLPPLAYGPCIKCGGVYAASDSGAHPHHVYITHRYESPRSWPHRPARIRRECGHCGATWYERPADAAAREGSDG